MKFGRMYMREYSDDGNTFHLPVTRDCMLSFSRILFDEEMLVVYNTSLSQEDKEYIAVNPELNPEGSRFRFLYGADGEVHVLSNESHSHHFVKLNLKPGQFVILTNQ